MNSIKGNYVFMSATIESGDVQVLQRFHHQHYQFLLVR